MEKEYSQFNKFHGKGYDENFEKYLILVGLRIVDFTYELDTILNNIEYFKKCHEQPLSAYKALLFFHDYLEDKNKTV